MIHFVLYKMDPWKNTPFGLITKIIPNDMHGKGFSQKINITHLKPNNALFSLYQFFVLSISRQCTAVRQGLYVFETDLSTPLNHHQIIKVIHWAFKSILNPPIHQQYSNLGWQCIFPHFLNNFSDSSFKIQGNIRQVHFQNFKQKNDQVNYRTNAFSKVKIMKTANHKYRALTVFM